MRAYEPGDRTPSGACGARRAARRVRGRLQRPSADDRTGSVGRLLALLTERQRAIVVAHYYLGLTQDEIAGALGIRRGTVSATVSQSLARMRKEGMSRG